MPRPCGSTTSPSPAPEASKFPCRQGKIQFRTNQYRKTLINQVIIESTDTLLAAEFAPLTGTEQGNCAHCRLAAAQAAAVASAHPTFQHLPILEQIISVDLDANMAKAPACGATTVTPEARLLFRRSGISRAKAGKDEIGIDARSALDPLPHKAPHLFEFYGRHLALQGPVPQRVANGLAGARIFTAHDGISH